MEPKKILLTGFYWALLLVITTLFSGFDTLTYADSSAEQQKRLEAHYGLLRPDGSGPFPAVMMVPGCEGFKSPSSQEYYANTAKKLKDQGFVVLKVDSVSARGRARCSEILPEDMIEDILTAARYLQTQPFVRAGAINVIGWSFGGGFALDALSKGDTHSRGPIAAVAVYCPDLDVAAPWKVDVPVLALLGAKDTITTPAKFESLLSTVPARRNVKYVTYPDAYHEFYNSGLPVEQPGLYGTIGYNEKAAKAAWEEVKRFLRR
jgi:dienelactone hydrolase